MWLLNLYLETEDEEVAEVLMVCPALLSEDKKNAYRRCSDLQCTIQCRDISSTAHRKTKQEDVQALNDERSGKGPTGPVPASRTAGTPVAVVSDGRVGCGVGASGSSGENSGP